MSDNPRYPPRRPPVPDPNLEFSGLDLSPLQLRIAKLVYVGMPDKSIATEIDPDGMTTGQASMLVNNLLRQLGVSNRTQASFELHQYVVAKAAGPVPDIAATPLPDITATRLFPELEPDEERVYLGIIQGERPQAMAARFKLRPMTVYNLSISSISTLKEPALLARVNSLEYTERGFETLFGPGIETLYQTAIIEQLRTRQLHEVEFYTVNSRQQSRIKREWPMASHEALFRERTALQKAGIARRPDRFGPEADSIFELMTNEAREVFVLASGGLDFDEMAVTLEKPWKDIESLLSAANDVFRRNFPVGEALSDAELFGIALERPGLVKTPGAGETPRGVE